MSDQINHHRRRSPETGPMTIIAVDQPPIILIDASSTRSVEINSMVIETVNRVFKADNGHYPTAVLAELSAVVRSLRATSPDSALADIADAKIGRILARGGGDNELGQGAPQCAK